MLAVDYSEGFSVRNCGPRTKLEYAAEKTYADGKSYCTSVSLAPRMVPRYFVTTIRVDGQEQGITYYERIDFVQRLRVKGFGETVNCFSKEATDNYTTTLTYNPEFKYYRYVTRLDLHPGQPMSEQFLDVPALETTCNGDLPARENGFPPLAVEAQ